MSDLLVERLKVAKRELTALKTAHLRGLGLLKVFDETVGLDIEGRTGLIWYVDIILQFSAGFAKFPFVQAIIGPGEVSSPIENIVYDESGYSCTVTIAWINLVDPVQEIVIRSMAPIISASQNWRKG